MPNRTPLTRTFTLRVPSPLERRFAVPVAVVVYFLFAAVVIHRSPQVPEPDRAKMIEALAVDP